jgi:hypoxanthine phosphoribosyltransferase
MGFIIPENYKLHYTQAEIERSIDERAVSLSKWVALMKHETKKEVVVVPLLTGALFFAADLLKRITESVQIAPIKSRSYQPESVNTDLPKVNIELLGLVPRDRAILIVDDICDSGRTLRVVESEFYSLGAIHVESFVLIQRILPKEKESPNMHIPKWVCFEYPGNEWFVGYGMDDAGSNRNLKDIYIITDS